MPRKAGSRLAKPSIDRGGGGRRGKERKEKKKNERYMSATLWENREKHIGPLVMKLPIQT